MTGGHDSRHAIVVGASSGIGLELVRQLAANGCKVAALARRSERLAGLAAGTAGATGAAGLGASVGLGAAVGEGGVVAQALTTSASPISTLWAIRQQGLGLLNVHLLAV